MAQDITGRKIAEVTFRNLTRRLKILSECNQAVVRAQNESDLLVQVCRIIVEIGGYRMAGSVMPGAMPPRPCTPPINGIPMIFPFSHHLGSLA